MSTTDFFHKITASVKASPAELLLMILKFSITHTLSLTAICNLISLINNVFEILILPESRYLIDKLFNFQEKVLMRFVKIVQIIWENIKKLVKRFLM